MKKERRKLLAVVMSFAMIVSNLVIMGPEIAKAATANSKVEMWIGETQVVTKGDVTLGTEYREEFSGQNLSAVYVGDDWTVYGQVNDGNIEHIFVRANQAGSMSLPGIRFKGHGELTVLAYSDAPSEEALFTDRKVDVTLDPYPVTESHNAWEGYAIYSEFYSDEDGGRPSDKFQANVMSGASHYSDVTGEIDDGAELQVNGIIKCTSFGIADLKEVNFGAEDNKLPYVFELNFKDSIEEIKTERPDSYKKDYWQIELQQSQINAFVEDGLCKAGTYLEGWEEKSQNFASIWIYNEGKLAVDGKLGAVESMKVMTGGVITAKAEDAFEDNPEAISAYYSAEGTYKVIPQTDKRIQDFVEEHTCEAVTTEDDTKAYRCEYSIDEDKNLRFASTSSLLGLVGIDIDFNNDSLDAMPKEPAHGHFEVIAGSGIMNDKGCFWAEKGTEVKFVLVPDPGYQYKKGTFTCNGAPITDSVLFKATENIGEYVYTMGANACGLSCEFEPAEDEIEVKSDAVEAAEIDMGDNGLCGSMEFEVSDDEDITEEEKGAIENAAEGYEVGAVLDLSLTQKVDTVNGDDAWENPISELEEDMSVSLKVDESIADNTDYEIVRVHDGEVEVLPQEDVSYNPDDDTITFSTDKYSTYAIAYKAFKGIDVNLSKVTLYTGKYENTKKIEVTKYGVTGTATWKSSNTKIAKVSSTGKITAVKAGECTITVTVDGFKKKIAVTVKNPSISVKNGTKAISSITVKKGKTVKLTVKATPSKEKITLQKLSAKYKKIATVSYKSGKLTIKGKKKGTIKIKLTAGKGSKTIKIVVK